MRRLDVSILSLCLVACGRDEVPPDGPALPSLAEPAPASSVDVPTKSDGPPMPRPYRGRLGAAVELNETCIPCHDDQAKQWRGSHHQISNANPAYRKAFAIEPSPFCRGCHAPEADPRADPPDAVSALGIGCVTCHVTEEGLILAAASPERDDAKAPHPLRRSAEFGQTGGCANCHEFRFPTARGDDDDAYMQTTLKEHRRGGAAAKPCAECHMPLVSGRRSHSFAEVRDPAYLRENMRASAELGEESTLRITLTQTAPGHDFPTGDLFRRLEIGCELKTQDGKVLRREVRYSTRHFETVAGQTPRRLMLDDRVGGEPRVFEMELPAPPSKPRPSVVSWWVTYQRVATIGDGKDPAKATVESEVALHSGTIPWKTQ